MQTKRVEYIDLAKGFCILLVVLFHCSIFFKYPLPFKVLQQSFRMPLYFFLSGLFFKDYGIRLFFVKKTNKLLIPFLFFFLTTSWLLVAVTDSFWGVKIYESHGYSLNEIVVSLCFIEQFANSAIWFLLCLFEVNIVFYCIYQVSELIKKNKAIILMVLSFFVGFCGLVLSYNEIRLPLFFDSTLVCIPFFYMGFYSRNNTSLLKEGRYDKYNIVFSIIMLTIVYFLAEPVNFRKNIMSHYECYMVYPCGILGTLSILLIAKTIKVIPGISYIGRYSIIILVTHMLLLQFYGYFVSFLDVGFGVKTLLTFLLIVLSSFIVIPVFRRVFPWFVAQKDLLKI